jgi:Ankyrin repeats (3 copies)
VSNEVLIGFIIAIALFGFNYVNKVLKRFAIGFMFLIIIALYKKYSNQVMSLLDTIGWDIVSFYVIMLMIAILLVVYVVYAYRKLAQIDNDFYNAVYENETEIALDILQKDKPNVNIKNGMNSTPIMNAAYNGNIEIVIALLERKAKVNVINRYGFTAYVVAKYRGYDQIANLLVKAGAKKIKPNVEFLIDCVKDENIEGVRRCLSSGINPMTLGVNKKSAFKIALNKGNNTIISYLLKYGASTFVSRASLPIQEMYKTNRYLKYIEDYEREYRLKKNG